MHPIVFFIEEELKRTGDPKTAEAMQAYMKTQQMFYGVPAVPRRKIFKSAISKYKIDTYTDYSTIVMQLWQGKYREEMYQAIEFAEHFRNFHNKQSWSLFENLVLTATHWDTLDWIVSKLISPLVLKNKMFEKKIVKWIKHKNVWVRRASLLAHLHHREKTNTDLMSMTILMLAHETDFFIRKAIGWVLRDYSYSNPKWVQYFVTTNKDVLSELSKREALKVINKRKA